MKLDQLRKIIREEVRSAIKEELQDILTEAVTIASAPETKAQPVKKSIAAPKAGNVTLDEMLSQTAQSMTSEDYRSVGNFDSNSVPKPNFASSMASKMGMTESSGPMPGIDITQLDFVKKAKAVFDTSVQKDKARFGV